MIRPRPVKAVRQRLGRRRRYSREFIDHVAWPHPRPAHDPRLVALHIALPWVALIQVFTSPGPSSVQAQAFAPAATIAFSSLMIVSSCLVLYAAFCRSQYWSFGAELAGCVGFTFVFFLYSVALIDVIEGWYSTNGAAWSLAFFIGNAIRAATLGWRLW